MNDLSTLLYNVRCFLGVVSQLLWHGVRFCWDLLLPKAVLAARLTASESQLAELLERARRESGAPPRLRSSDGTIRSRPGLGGLHHEYFRTAG